MKLFDLIIVFSDVEICELSKHISQYLKVTQHTEHSHKLVKVLLKHCIYLSMLRKLQNIFYDYSHETLHIPLIKNSIQKDRNFNVFSSDSFRNAITIACSTNLWIFHYFVAGKTYIYDRHFITFYIFSDNVYISVSKSYTTYRVFTYISYSIS